MFHHCAYYGNFYALVEIIHRIEANNQTENILKLNSVDKYGYTPLYLSCIRGYDTKHNSFLEFNEKQLVTNPILMEDIKKLYSVFGYDSRITRRLAIFHIIFSKLQEISKISISKLLRAPNSKIGFNVLHWAIYNRDQFLSDYLVKIDPMLCFSTSRRGRLPFDIVLVKFDRQEMLYTGNFIIGHLIRQLRIVLEKIIDSNQLRKKAEVDFESILRNNFSPTRYFHSKEHKMLIECEEFAERRIKDTKRIQTLLGTYVRSIYNRKEEAMMDGFDEESEKSRLIRVSNMNRISQNGIFNKHDNINIEIKDPVENEVDSISVHSNKSSSESDSSKKEYIGNIVTKSTQRNILSNSNSPLKELRRGFSSKIDDDQNLCVLHDSSFIGSSLANQLNKIMHWMIYLGHFDFVIKVIRLYRLNPFIPANSCGYSGVHLLTGFNYEDCISVNSSLNANRVLVSEGIDPQAGPIACSQIEIHKFFNARICKLIHQRCLQTIQLILEQDFIIVKQNPLNTLGINIGCLVPCRKRCIYITDPKEIFEIFLSEKTAIHLDTPAHLACRFGSSIIFSEFKKKMKKYDCDIHDVNKDAINYTRYATRRKINLKQSIHELNYIKSKSIANRKRIGFGELTPFYEVMLLIEPVDDYVLVSMDDSFGSRGRVSVIEQQLSHIQKRIQEMYIDSLDSEDQNINIDTIFSYRKLQRILPSNTSFLSCLGRLHMPKKEDIFLIDVSVDLLAKLEPKYKEMLNINSASVSVNFDEYNKKYKLEKTLKESIVYNLLCSEMDIWSFTEEGFILDLFPTENLKERENLFKYYNQHQKKIKWRPIQYNLKSLKSFIPSIELSRYHGIAHGYFFEYLLSLNIWIFMYWLLIILLFLLFSWDNILFVIQHFYNYGFSRALTPDLIDQEVNSIYEYLSRVFLYFSPIVWISSGFWSAVFSRYWLRTENILMYIFEGFYTDKASSLVRDKYVGDYVLSQDMDIIKKSRHSSWIKKLFFSNSIFIICGIFFSALNTKGAYWMQEYKLLM